MKNTGKTIFFVTLITLLPKVLMLIVSAMLGAVFGSDNVYVQIYSYVTPMPNNIFVAVGTSLTTIVIPVYSGLLAKKNYDRGKIFLDNVISISSVVSIILVGLAILLAPLIVGQTRYKNDPKLFDYALFALRTLFPIMFFFCLNYIFQGILQSHERFKLAAAVSLPSSLVLILYMFFGAEKFGVTGLLFAFLLGCGLQPLLLLPGVIKTGYKYKFSFDLKNEDISKSLRLIPAVLLGVSAYQINMIFNNTFSTYFQTEYLMNLVQNLMLTPVLMIISSITSIYFPKMSAFWGANDIEGYKKSITEIINTLCFLLIPAAVGIIILKHDIISIIRWGSFEEADGITAGNILGFYALSIVFVGLKEALDKALYARQSTKPSAVVGVLIMASNIIISLMLKNKLGTYCMPVAYSLSSFIGSMSLLYLVVKKTGRLDKYLFKNLLKCVISAIIMGAFVYLTRNLLTNTSFGFEIIDRAVRLFVPVLIGVTVYFAAAFVLKVTPVYDFFVNIKARRH